MEFGLRELEVSIYRISRLHFSIVSRIWYFCGGIYSINAHRISAICKGDSFCVVLWIWNSNFIIIINTICLL